MKWMQRIGAALSAWMIFGFGAVAGAEAALPAATEFPSEAAVSAAPEKDAVTVVLEQRGLELGESTLAYPVVTGLKDAELEKAVNDRILEDLRIPEYVTRISQLISGGKLKVGWRGGVLGDVLSCAVFAEGAVSSPRTEFVWSRSNIDLQDGHEITWEELFSEPEAAREGMEAWLEETIAPELSAHLLNGNVTPLPEAFYLTQRGPVLLYESDQWCTLSDRAGDLLIGWDEIQDWLDLSQGSIPDRIGASGMITLTEESLGALREMTEEGAIPSLPVRLGDSVRDAVAEWHLLIDPDLYENGRMFSLEGGLFRGVFLLTDYLSESWENSRVDGIRLDSGCLFGLRIGQTTAAEWHQMLGEPDTSVDFDGEKAEAYRTEPGTRDYYTWGEHTLQLHADEDGILISILLKE